MDPSGEIVGISTNTPDLPPKYRAVSSPETIRLAGDTIRLTGGPYGAGGYLVVGEDMSFVNQAQRSLLMAMGAALIPFLVLVFLAALTIGRVSAQPIDAARRRLLAFTADASHELRTPLQVIEAETSLALLRKRTAESYRETIVRVADESVRLRNLVEDLLFLARFDNQNRPPAPAVVDLATAAARAVQRFESVAVRREQRLSLRLEDGPAPTVNVPEGWLDRLLGVLLDNACRYTPDGGSIEVHVRVAGGRVQLRVDDSGPGVPPHERAAVFERFHRATDKGGGSGLGLAIGNAIVEATRGRWELGTSDAGGASFAVWWPQARQARTRAEAIEPVTAP
jgi:signal transduction histidine kinase